MPSDKKQDDLWAMQIPSAPPMPEWVSPADPFEVQSVSENIPAEKENPELQEASSSFHNSHLERENQSPPKRKLEEKDSLPDAFHTEKSVSSPMPLGVLLASDAQLEVENCSLEARFTTEVLSEGKNRSPLRRSDSVSFLYAHTRREGCSDAGIEAENQEGNMYVEQDKGKEENQKNVLGSFSASHAAESVSSSIPLRVLSASDAQLEIEHCSLEACLATEVQFEEENKSPPPINSGQRDMSSIWTRRGKSANLIQLHTGRKVTSHAGIKADKQKAIMYVEQDKREEDTLCKAIFFGADEEDEPIPSEKENMTPQGHPNLKLEKGKPKVKKPELLKSSLEVTDADSDIEDNVLSADKENRTPKLSYEMKSRKQISENQRSIKPDMMVKRRAERVPFQSLVENSSNSKSASVRNATSRNSNSVNYTHIMKENNSSSSVS